MEPKIGSNRKRRSESEKKRILLDEDNAHLNIAESIDLMGSLRDQNDVIVETPELRP